jgi:hypothetical protein
MHTGYGVGGIGGLIPPGTTAKTIIKMIIVITIITIIEIRTIIQVSICNAEIICC